jgi:hypothetical protein
MTPTTSTSQLQIAASMHSSGNCEDTVQDRGELYRVDFNSEEMKGRAFRANPIKHEHVKRKIGLTAFIVGVNNKAIA